MNEYIYPTRANYGDEWLRNMLNDWINSGLPNVSFPWLKFYPRTLEVETDSFWMYMYYTGRITDIPRLRGKIEYRIHVIDWRITNFFEESVFNARSEDEDVKIWLKCDKFEEIRNKYDQLLALDDFKHPHNKKLSSAIRNTIAPVVCLISPKVIRMHP